MSSPPATLPIHDTLTVESQQQVADVVRQSATAGQAVYPIGGGSSLDYGLPAVREGMGLSLASLKRVVDYPARDMTITVEAGLGMQALDDILSEHQQQLPLDVPAAGQATIGGVVACNANGFRRYQAGTVRDYVIGITAVDGRGQLFRGGGRVVKNVAGYDFCKLLTGSLGTLAVITQLTLRVKPIPPVTQWMACRLADWQQADRLLISLAESQTTPAAIEMVSGGLWSSLHELAPLNLAPQDGAVVVCLEGTAAEVRWMQQQLLDEWQRLGVQPPISIEGPSASQLRSQLCEFAALPDSPLVLQASLRPSQVLRFVQAVRQLDAASQLQAHAGNGIVKVRFSEFPADGLSRSLVANLQPVAKAAGGHLVVLSNPSGAEMTRQSVWGAVDAPLELMKRVKQHFDPHDILNPGRFVYPGIQ